MGDALDMVGDNSTNVVPIPSMRAIHHGAPSEASRSIEPVKVVCNLISPIVEKTREQALNDSNSSFSSFSDEDNTEIKELI